MEYPVATVRRLAPVALVLAALAVGTVACGSRAVVVSSAAPSGAAARPASTWPASLWSGRGPLAGRSVGWILRQTFADAVAAPVVRIQGTVVKSGQAYSLNLSMVAGHGCTGTLTMAGRGTVTLISDGKNLWMKPDVDYWRATGASQATLAVVAGKYVAANPGDARASAMANMCSLKLLLSGFMSDRANWEIKGGTAVIGGQRVVEISDSAGPAYGYVTDATKPELLQITVPGTPDSRVNFAYPGTPPAISPPPASETIDGSQYGL